LFDLIHTGPTGAAFAVQVKVAWLSPELAREVLAPA
jgi:hypothetical protein